MNTNNLFFNKRKKGIALASYPRSGNTWMRFLLEEISGQKTGSVYKDRILARDKEGIVVKTHKLDAKAYTAAIYLIRNPYNSILSYYYFKKEVAEEENISWEDHFKTEVKAWRKHVEYWMNAKIPVFRIKFEDFQENPIPHLKYLLSWIGVDKCTTLSLENAIQATSIEKLREKNNTYGSKFFRTGKVQAELNSLNNADRAYLNEELRDLLLLFNYKDLLL